MSTFGNDYKKKQDDFLQLVETLRPEEFKLFFYRKGVHFKTHMVTFNGKPVTLKKFKYGPSCRFGENWMLATRGVTMITDNNQCSQTFFPMNKFFNFNREFPTHLGMDPKEFCASLEKQGLKSLMMNKMDGTNIQTCYPFGYPLSMTLGSVNPDIPIQPKIAGSPTFSALSLKLLEEQYPTILEYLRQHPKESLVSELCSVWNPIVTVYKHHGEGKIIPLMIINDEGICEIGPLRILAPELFDANGFPCGSMTLSAATFEEDQLAFMRNVEAHPELFGQNPEGFDLWG